MSADQEQPQRPVPAALAIVCSCGIAGWVLGPLLLDFLDEHGAEDLGGIAWEITHGLPKWRRHFRQGWREQAEREP